MTKRAYIARISIGLFYTLFFLFFILLYKIPINRLIENKYVLITNIQIDTVTERHYSGSGAGSSHGYTYSIAFQFGDKKESFILRRGSEQEKRVFKQITRDSIRTIDLVRIENCKAFIQCTERYYPYDERFFCDEKGICNFTDTYKKKQVMYLIFGGIFFLVVTTIIYKLFKSNFVKTL
jgi:hypothetical protein